MCRRYRCHAIRTNSYRLENVIAAEDLSERESGFERRWSLTGQGVALEISPRVVSTCRKHGRGGWKWFRFLGCWGRAGKRGAGGGVRRGGWFQYEPADASHADHRWYLCSISMESEFMSYVLLPSKKKKKQRSLALDTRFGRNNATAKRPGMKNWFLSETHEGNFVYVAPI